MGILALIAKSGQIPNVSVFFGLILFLPSLAPLMLITLNHVIFFPLPNYSVSYTFLSIKQYNCNTVDLL